MRKIGQEILPVICLVAFGLLSSCSGYRFKYKDNPFARHGIQSVTIPLFLNQSVFANVSAKMTREIKKVLENQTNLTIYAGNNKNADAVLVGIVKSAKHRRTAIKPNRTTLVTAGSRAEFYVPTGNLYYMDLLLVLIKAPTKLDMKLIQSDLLPYIHESPKVLFTRTLKLGSSITRFADNGTTPDSGEVVNFTRTKKAFEQSVEKLAIIAAQQFEGLILYAF